MGLFNRKKKVIEKEETIPEIPHEHTWKDMPWYIKYSYNGGSSKVEYTIMEPYLCITCGKRKDVILETRSLSGVDYKEGMAFVKEAEKRYEKYLQPVAVVEDMINNIILVKDAETLEMIECMRGLPHKGVGTSSVYRIKKKPSLKLGDEE